MDKESMRLKVINAPKRNFELEDVETILNQIDKILNIYTRIIDKITSVTMAVEFDKSELFSGVMPVDDEL